MLGLTKPRKWLWYVSGLGDGAKGGRALGPLCLSHFKRGQDLAVVRVLNSGLPVTRDFSGSW